VSWTLVPVVAATDSNIRRAAEILRRGGVVAFPTETVYGLGADALDARACAKVFAIKRRPHFDPLIVHLAGEDALGALCTGVDERVRRLAAAFWPGPLTLVLPRTDLVPDLVTAGLPTVAVRVPAHPVALALIALAERPVAAPSANPFGYISPTLASHVEAQIGADVELILDGGPCAVGVESTIVDLSTERAVLLRPGATEIERIEAIIGTLDRPAKGSALRAPGQLVSHYAPRTAVVRLAGRAGPAPEPSVGLLAFGRPSSRASGYRAIEVLSESEDLQEAAANLFACLHRLDAARLSVIHAEPVPERGLGVAIVDRLRRAAGGGGETSGV
jgi:L-threonylcarbamoyladenylate synthase